MSGDGVIDTVGDAVAGVPLAEAVVDAAEAVFQDQSPMGLIAAVLSGTSEVSGIIDDPIGSFFASGVGWIIEAIPALQSALDAVSGNEENIEDLNKLWTEQIAKPLAGVADDVRSAAVATASGWSGVDATAYRTTTTALAEHSEALGTAARATAAGMSFAGSLVLEVRTFIRDELSKLLVWAVAAYAVATASSIPTGGASVVAATNTILLRGAALAQRFAGVLRKLTTKLESLAEKFASLGTAARALKRASTGIDNVAASTTRAVDDGIVVQTAFHLMGKSPISSATEVAASAGTSAIKATGDGWSSWAGSQPA
ncbi:hypothetical protein AXK57_09520 [Tsukamurella pulmonis]|uniref:PPE family protein n=3 Tax=Tsukamurella pulmonis TaxID=47312 RepID=A0A1H1FQJ1_9ACTN|nr:hypothetical protein AXK56_14555 [Tsukamurella pulmonis]KXP10567.1 hypothetical protein AXK57_09520 [Tsukamurella pulmonis]SDR03333.1 hypothetical protein SAMN04489765_2865 [Tsukamurella pulmonis]SUP18570.1 Uncharacterised protein [Tsukamurella pulmonis]